MNTIENAPALNLDKILYKDSPMPPHVRRERRIVWNLMKHLAASGWTPVRVYDGEENTRVATPKRAMEVIFNLDDAELGFMSFKPFQANHIHYVKLVLGNDIDVISDWNYFEGDPDGFNAAMDKFDAEAFA